MNGTMLQRAWLRIAAATTAALLVLGLGGCTGGPRPPDDRETPVQYAALEEFSRQMIEDGAPAVLIQARHGGETWNHAAGVRNLETREPAAVSDAFRVGSITEVHGRRLRDEAGGRRNGKPRRAGGHATSRNSAPSSTRLAR